MSSQVFFHRPTVYAASQIPRPHQPWAATKHAKKARPPKPQSQPHCQQARSPPQVERRGHRCMKSVAVTHPSLFTRVAKIGKKKLQLTTQWLNNQRRKRQPASCRDCPRLQYNRSREHARAVPVSKTVHAKKANRGKEERISAGTRCTICCIKPLASGAPSPPGAMLLAQLQSQACGYWLRSRYTHQPCLRSWRHV